MKLLLRHEALVMGVALPTFAVLVNLLVWQYYGYTLFQPLYLLIGNLFFLMMVGYLFISAKIRKTEDPTEANGLINRQTTGHSHFEPFNNGVRNIFWGVYLALWICIGFAVGRYNFMTYVEPYILTEQGSVYHDVSPVDSAALKEDAGIVHFSGAVLNVNMARSYKWKKTNYCVAPIMTEAGTVENIRKWMTAEKPKVEYFAVGTDCCYNGSFNDCITDVGSAGTGNAGVVLRRNWYWDETKKIPPPEQAKMDDDLAFFQKAGESAASYYGLDVGTEPLYVIWTDNATGIQDARSEGAWRLMLIAFLICLGLSVAASATVFFLVKRQERKATALLGGNAAHNFQEEMA